MQSTLQSLNKGQKITVTVVEIQNERQILVSYRGELLRVRNHSAQRFQVGEKIILVVTHVKPVEFSLAGEGRLFSRVI